MPFPTDADTDALLTQLDAAPGCYADLLRGRDDAELRARRSPDEWSPLEILAHVRAGDDLLTGRVYVMLVRDNPPFMEVDERRWDEIAGYIDYPLDLLLDSYALRRRELVLMLRRIDANAWKRTGEHAKRGRVTVFSVVKHISDHEIEHLATLRELLPAHD